MDKNKERHINLLLAENKKNSKKKRVSFSIFQAETFDEIEQLRKMKESALNNFQQQKTKTNEYRDMISRNSRINTSESKSNDSSSGKNDSNESDNRNMRKGGRGSMDNNKQIEDKSKENVVSNISVIKKESEQLGDIKQIEKERKRKEAEDKKKKEEEEGVRKQLEVNKQKQIEEERIKQEEAEKQSIIEEEAEKQRLIDEERIKKEIEEKLNKEMEEKLTKEIEDKLRIEIEDKLRKELEEKIQKEIEEKIQKENEERLHKAREEQMQLELEEQLQQQKENEERLQRENEERRQREREDQLQREREEQRQKEKEMKKQRDVTLFTNMLSLILFSNKQKYINYNLFKSGCIKYITKKEDDFINYETTNPQYTTYVNNKTKLYSLKANMMWFLSHTRRNINRRRKYLHQMAKGNKYILYCQYKQKAIIYDALHSYARKQRNWINSIRNEISKGLVWSCLDSLKIYTNYKKIKAYLSLQKKRKIFYSLRKNLKIKHDLERKSHTAFLIFIYKNFIAKIRKDILIKKGIECDEYISTEFRKQALLKKVFNIIQTYYSIKKEKMKKTKKLFQVKHQNSEYINIKVCQKETIKYSNKNIVTKQTSNRINIV